MLHRRPMLLLLLVLVLLVCCHRVDAWDYADKGVSWVTSNPQFCSGRRQSPIDLGVSSSMKDASLGDFVFEQSAATTAYTAKVTNTGYSIKLSWSSAYQIRMGLTAGNMHYTAEQLHYHWGSANDRGSEHTVDGASYPAEGHLVFWNSRDYANFSDAVTKPNGLAVLGVFLQLSSTDNQLLAALQPQISSSTVQLASGERTVPKNVSNLNVLDLLLPSDRSSYYRYDGSLTTPDCYETVMWTVFKETMPISAAQLTMLRSLKFVGNTTQMQDNYRVVQALNPASTNRPGTRRELYRSFSSAGVARAVEFVVTVAAVAAAALPLAVL